MQGRWSGEKEEKMNKLLVAISVVMISGAAFAGTGAGGLNWRQLGDSRNNEPGSHSQYHSAVSVSCTYPDKVCTVCKVNNAQVFCATFKRGEAE